jgi:tetratricopeptide (TPR) repeat protein
MGNRNDEAQARAHLANVYRVWGSHSDALASAQAALMLALETGEKRTETWVRNALGATHQAMGNTSRATDEYSTALAVAREIGARYEECEALIGLARSRGSREDAEAALALARDTGYLYLAEQVSALLAEAGFACAHDRLGPAGDA